MHVTTDVLIIGGGISGIIIAKALQEAGINVCLLEKENILGGRMKTLQIGAGYADTGASFFTVRSPQFQDLVTRWQADGLVYVWANGFNDGSLLPQRTTTTGHPRYAVQGGMNALPQTLAKDLKDVRTNQTIVTATYDHQGWILQNQEGDIFTSNVLVMALPIPQAFQILTEGATDIDEGIEKKLRSIEYAPCLAGIFLLESDDRLPHPGAIQRKNTNILWIGDNQQKGISPDATVITIQANKQYSIQMWDAPDNRVLNAMRTHLQVYLPRNTTFHDARVERWQYARPLAPLTEPYLMTDENPPLVFVGDAFNGARVEGAVISGLAAAEALMKKLL